MPTEVISPANHTVILLSYENDFRQSRGADRQDVLKSIMEEISTQYDPTPTGHAMKGLAKVSQLIQTSSPEPSSICVQRIEFWYGNNKTVQHGDKSIAVQVGTVWNHRLVVQHQFKDQVAEELAKYKLAPDAKDRMQKYQWSTNAVIKSLGGDAAVKEYAALAKTWNETEAPEELKRK